LNYLQKRISNSFCQILLGNQFDNFEEIDLYDIISKKIIVKNIIPQFKNDFNKNQINDINLIRKFLEEFGFFYNFPNIGKTYFLIKIITLFLQYFAENDTFYRILITAAINDPINNLVIKFYDNCKIVFSKDREIVIIRYYFLPIENKIYIKPAHDERGKAPNI
jgi:hypothetical protein